MSIERKRNLLRVSRERLINAIKPQNKEKSDQQITNVAEEKREANYNQEKRIKTEVKSSYLGNSLHPHYINKFRGGTFIVAGCGSSINLYDDFSKYYVIGVNDIERVLTPDFLVVVNDYRTFMRGRWDYV